MIGVIINPRARRVVAEPSLPRRLTRVGGRRVLVVVTHETADLRQALARFAEAGVSVVAVCGGDGTIRAVLTEMIEVFGVERLPRLAVLRGGTVNTVAANLGIRGHPERILGRLVAHHERGAREPAVTRTVLRVNGSCGFLFGAAMGARFFEIYNGGPISGLGWAALLAARVTASSLLRSAFARRLFEPVRALITVDGARLPHDLWSMLVAATVENVGLHIRIAYRALQRAGCFHLVASGLPPFDLARQLPRTLLARPLRGAPHFDMLARETLIEFERQQAYIMDGDLFRASRLTLRHGPPIEVSVP